jgi:hypothetical protein
VKEVSTSFESVRFIVQLHNWISKQEIGEMGMSYNEFSNMNKKMGEMKVGNIFNKMLN